MRLNDNRRAEAPLSRAEAAQHHNHATTMTDTTTEQEPTEAQTTTDARPLSDCTAWGEQR